MLDDEVSAVGLPKRPDYVVTVYRGLGAMGQGVFAVQECVVNAFDEGRGIEDRVVELNPATGEADPYAPARS